MMAENKIIEEKIAQLETIFAKTQQLNEIIEDIEEAILVGKASNYVSQPISTLILGLSGVGKTTLMEHFKSKYPQTVYRDDEKEQEIIPIVSTTLTDDKNPRAAPGKMLRDIGDPLKGEKGTRSVLGDRYVGLTKDLETKCIFIDEFQHAFSVSNDNQKAGAADWIKNLINQSKIPVVLFGMPWCLDIIKRSSEMSNRFDNIHHIDTFGREEESFAEWIELLRQIDEQLPFDNKANLDDPQFALRLMTLTGGNLSKLMKKVIKPAARKAIFANENSLGVHRLLAAARKHLGVPEEYNPLSNNIAIDTLKVKHFLTEEEDTFFKDRKKTRVYFTLSDENDLSKIFR